jgi:hypothetical protein
MAAGSEVPQKGVLQASGYTPVETRLNPPIQLQAADWAGVGRTALAAADQFNKTAQMIQASPLNPMVKAQQLAQKSASEAGIADQQWRNNLPNNFGRLMEYTDEHGNVISMAPGQIQDPTTLANLQAAMKIGAGGGSTEHGKAPAVSEETARDGDSSQTQTQDQGFESSEYPAAGGQQPPQPQQPKKKTPPTAEQQAHPGSTQTSTVSPALMAGGSDEQALAAARAASSGSDAAQEGTPASMTFTNPATGNVEPLKTDSVFASRPAAPAPPAPTGPQQPPVSQTPAAATQADQAAMQKWQNQNAHPVMSSQDALAWAKNQSTLNTDATYLPMGGPGGSPAFAFHVKGGGMNIVPVSQMVQKGAGPLVAAQNTSQVISSTDQQQQPNISPPPPANLPQQPNISPPPPANLPPAAPGIAPMPTGTGAAAPQPVSATPGPTAAPPQQYPNISGPPPAPVPGAYDPTAYRQGIAQAIADPRNLMAQTAPAGQVAQPVQQPEAARPIQPQRDMWDIVPANEQAAATAAAKAMGPAPVGPYAGDRRVEGDTGPYTYYINDDPKARYRGRVYTVLPGPSGGYYDEKRWYIGTRDYERYELPDTQMKQHMKDYWSTYAGQLTPQEIDAMKPEEMKPWLQRAWYNDHMATSAPTTGYNSDLDAAENYHKSLVRIANLLQALENHGYTNLGTGDRLRSVGATTARSVGIPGQVAGMTDKDAAAMRELDQEVSYAEGLANSHPGLQTRTSQSQGLDLQAIPMPGGGHLPNVGGSTALSDIAFSGQDLKTKLDHLHALQVTGDARYKDLIGQGSDQRMVVAPKHDANVIRLGKGQDLQDDGDQYKAHSYPGDPETVALKDLPEFIKTHPPGTQFMTKGRQAHLMATPSAQ